MVFIESIYKPFSSRFRLNFYAAEHKHYRTVVFSWIGGNYGDHIECYHSLTCCEENDGVFRFTTRYGSEIINNELIDIETAVSIFEYLTGRPYEVEL